MPPIKKGDTVTVNYKGTLENGDVFDESKDHGPIEFKVKRQQKVFICGCGLTGDQPYCDGSCGVSLADRE